LKSHFDISASFAAEKLIGAPGKNGRSWPDLDMLPLGWITDPGSTKGPYKNTSLTHDEQRTQITLWSIAKSPLMFGGDMRHLDNWTLSLLTNQNLLNIDDNSVNNMQIWNRDNGNSRAWSAIGAMGETFVALFNLDNTDRDLTVRFSVINKMGTCNVKDLWSNGDLGSQTSLFTTHIPSHGAGIYSFTNCK